jgi:hypothetical protein
LNCGKHLESYRNCYYINIWIQVLWGILGLIVLPCMFCHYCRLCKITLHLNWKLQKK